MLHFFQFYRHISFLILSAFGWLAIHKQNDLSVKLPFVMHKAYELIKCGR